MKLSTFSRGGLLAGDLRLKEFIRSIMEEFQKYVEMKIKKTKSGEQSHREISLCSFPVAPRRNSEVYRIQFSRDECYS